MENTQTLAQRVAVYYSKCLDVNGSWCNFTNELGVLNTLDVLEDVNYGFVVELLQDQEDFEDEDYDELLLAVGEFLSDRTVPAKYIESNDLVDVMNETGFDAEWVAELARNAGVSEVEIEYFLSEDT